MSEHCLSTPSSPSRRLPEIRMGFAVHAAEHRTSEVREACLVGGFALAIFWVLAELAIAFGLR